MNRVIIIFLSLCIVLASELASAQADMKIEGSCSGQYQGVDISFNYLSAFDGCDNKSDAALSFNSEKTPDLKGTRFIGNGLDTYSFKAKKNGQLKTVYWLVFPDSTGNTHGVFKYRDSTGTLKSVRLECQIQDYEYSECRGSKNSI